MPKTHQPTVVVLPPRRDADGEYRVAVLVDGVDCEARAYYTDDRADALATAAAMRAECSADVASDPRA